MSRIELQTQQSAPADAAALLAQVQSAFGATPNMFRAVANAPAALASMWGSFGALGGGALGAKLGEQIAVAVADLNACEYCLAAHTALGRKAGLTGEQLAAAQAGHSADSATAAALRFATAIVQQRGRISADEVAAVRQGGFDDAAIMEIMAHVALNLYTNYVNVAFAVPLDFPAVALRAR